MCRAAQCREVWDEKAQWCGRTRAGGLHARAAMARKVKRQAPPAAASAPQTLVHLLHGRRAAQAACCGTLAGQEPLATPTDQPRRHRRPVLRRAQEAMQEQHGRPRVGYG